MDKLIRFIRAYIRKLSIERERHVRLSAWEIVGMHEARINWTGTDGVSVNRTTTYKYILLQSGYGKRDVKISWHGHFTSGYHDELQSSYAVRHQYYVDVILPWLHGSNKYNLSNEPPPRSRKLTIVK